MIRQQGCIRKWKSDDDVWNISVGESQIRHKKKVSVAILKNGKFVAVSPDAAASGAYPDVPVINELAGFRSAVKWIQAQE